jgi:hypothetical protein
MLESFKVPRLIFLTPSTFLVVNLVSDVYSCIFKRIPRQTDVPTQLSRSFSLCSCIAKVQPSTHTNFNGLAELFHSELEGCLTRGGIAIVLHLLGS